VISGGTKGVNNNTSNDSGHDHGVDDEEQQVVDHSEIVMQQIIIKMEQQANGLQCISYSTSLPQRASQMEEEATPWRETIAREVVSWRGNVPSTSSLSEVVWDDIEPELDKHIDRNDPEQR